MFLSCSELYRIGFSHEGKVDQIPFWWVQYAFQNTPLCSSTVFDMWFEEGAYKYTVDYVRGASKIKLKKANKKNGFS